MDKIRAGVFYFSAGQRVAVEVGATIIGHTSQNAKGNQVYWFKSVADFERLRKDLFEATNPLYKPIPCFEVLTGMEGALENIQAIAKLQEAVEKLGFYVGWTSSGEPVVSPKKESPIAAARASMAPVAELPPPPPLPEKSPDEIFAALAGRKPRIQEFAAELNMDPARLKTLIEADPRYAPIVGGWVRTAEQTS